MYKFQKVRNKDFDIDHGLMLVLSNVEEVMNYHEITMKAQVSRVWDNLCEVMEGKAHIDSPLGSLIHFTSRQNEKKSLLELTAIVLDKVLNAKLETLEQYGKLYVNKNGGFFPHTDNIEILEEVIMDNNSSIFHRRL